MSTPDYEALFRAEAGGGGVSDGPTSEVEKLQFVVRNLALVLQMQVTMLDSLLEILVAKGYLGTEEIEVIKSDLQDAVNSFTSG